MNIKSILSMLTLILCVMSCENNDSGAVHATPNSKESQPEEKLSPEVIIKADSRVRKGSVVYMAKATRIPTKTSVFDMWIPLPRQCAVQKITRMKIDTEGHPYKVTMDSEYHNRMVYLHLIKPPSEVTVTITFNITRYPQKAETRKASMKLGYSALTAWHKYMPRNVEVITRVNHIIGSEKNAFDKARKVFDHTLETLTYNPDQGHQGVYSVVSATRQGQALDFNSYFVTHLRSAGVRSYVEVGYELPQSDNEVTLKNTYAWSYFKVAETYYPVDTVKAKTTGVKGPHYKQIDAHRISFSRGRSYHLSPRQRGDTMSYFIGPHVEIDGQHSTQAESHITYKEAH